MPPIDDFVERRRQASAIRKAHNRNPKWHPEHRVGPPPARDFTQWDPLHDALEAWRTQDAARHQWALHSAGMALPAEGFVHVGARLFTGTDPHPVVSLAQAFDQALAQREEVLM